MPDHHQRAWRWGLVLIAAAAGWAGGHAPSIDPVGQARAATLPGDLERLVAEDEIRRRVALFGLYVDGGGTGGRPRDLRTLADTLMTPDVVNEVIPANGGAPLVLTGRDGVAGSRSGLDPERARRIAGRHYLINTAFDAITAATAATRTTALYVDASKNLVGHSCAVAKGEDCGGTPEHAYMWIYEMRWRRTAQGWQIDHNTLRNDN